MRERRAAAARYFKLLDGTPFLTPPFSSLNSSAWHLYPVRMPPALSASRDTIFTAMRAAGIGVHVHHVPVYRHPYYESLGYKKGLCPKAEAFVDSELSLPIFPGITLRQQRFIVDELCKHILKR